MAKLNFYDTDAVKAFVLDILIENAELKSDLDYEKKCSNDWFDRYKKADQQANRNTDQRQCECLAVNQFLNLSFGSPQRLELSIGLNILNYRNLKNVVDICKWM